VLRHSLLPGWDRLVGGEGAFPKVGERVRSTGVPPWKVRAHLADGRDLDRLLALSAARRQALAAGLEGLPPEADAEAGRIAARVAESVERAAESTGREQDATRRSEAVRRRERATSAMVELARFGLAEGDAAAQRGRDARHLLRQHADPDVARASAELDAAAARGVEVDDLADLAAAALRGGGLPAEVAAALLRAVSRRAEAAAPRDGGKTETAN